jgi:isoquinoline 1-oxidoreductase subunit alpha
LLTAEPLALRVLDAVAQASNWTSPPAPGLFRGIAYNCYVGRGGRFKTYVAEVVELMNVGDRFKVKRVLCAVDPGLVVNPNTVTAQIEGGIGFAMTTALHSRITFSRGGADQKNFFDYPLLTIDEMPEVVPIVLPSDRPPQGFGEVVLATVGTGDRASPAAGDGAAARCHAISRGCISEITVGFFTITVNGASQSIEVDGDTPLLWVLRDNLGLTGTKFGCGIALCGACTVFVDGKPLRACSLPISALGEGSVTTIEGVSGPEAAAVQGAWVARDVPQCGYCQSGQVMSAIALLKEIKKPTDRDIDLALSGNLCRCATYIRIRAAIHDAARALVG